MRMDRFDHREFVPEKETVLNKDRSCHSSKAMAGYFVTGVETHTSKRRVDRVVAHWTVESPGTWENIGWSRSAVGG